MLGIVSKKNKNIIVMIIVAWIIFMFQYILKLNLYGDNKTNVSSSISSVEILIPNGASTNDIAIILKEKGIIESKLIFKILSKINKNDGQYRYGIHILDTSMDYKKIMSELKKITMTNETLRITIPEGYEIRQIINKLADENIINKKTFEYLVDHGNFNYDFINSIPVRKNRLEGYLFPDTYEIYINIKEEDIIIKMLDRFKEKFKDEYYQRIQELGMTLDEIITLASIIEREVMLDSERSIVSSVFYNRLKDKTYPYLESCATVQYILGERKPVLTLKDTKIDSPYNTYKFPGLPPGPIASPGEESIKAALYPDKTDYMFFSSNGDGSHTFSKTYEDHLKTLK